MNARAPNNSYDPRDYRDILESREKKRRSYLAHKEARLEARCQAVCARASYFRARLKTLLIEYENARYEVIAETM